jgi:hypothetical protein
MGDRRNPKRPRKDVTRREFVRQSVQLGAAAIATGFASSVAAQGSPDEYEYIVVGSGAGGGPVAANLARAGFRVLLLEAGGAARQRRDSSRRAFRRRSSSTISLVGIVTRASWKGPCGKCRKTRASAAFISK